MILTFNLILYFIPTQLVLETRNDINGIDREKWKKLQNDYPNQMCLKLVFIVAMNGLVSQRTSQCFSFAPNFFLLYGLWCICKLTLQINYSKVTTQI